MYFVNRSEIEKILHYYDGVLEALRRQSFQTNELPDSLLLERMIHVLAESILDTGNQMIDGFIMRDPGSYYDIVDILIDEKVLPENEASSYKTLIDARQQIVKEYHGTDMAWFRQVVTDHLQVLEKFSTHIRHYLDKEIGVANAFANEAELREQK